MEIRLSTPDLYIDSKIDRIADAAGCIARIRWYNANGARFARAICACGVRLLPPAAPDGKPSSAEPICSTCFDEIAAGSGRATRAPGRPN